MTEPSPPLFADHNVPLGAVELLRKRNWRVLTAVEEGLATEDDLPILEAASAAGAILITQDRDFGRLALLEAGTLPGLIYIRPGTLSAAAIAFAVELVVVDVVGSHRNRFLAVFDARHSPPRVRFRGLGPR